MSNVINWFEIPSADFDRAKAFYAALFQVDSLHEMEFPNLKMAVLPMADEEPGVGGAVVYAPDFYLPSNQGALIYLNGDPDLSAMLDRIEAAGGQILTPKTQISEDIGYMAVFQDTEGNRVALHSHS
ncbi:MAG: VOC family protein [Haliscomenobacter sp.]|nr:VOC family protein [Haliscomenobacter sp.]